MKKTALNLYSNQANPQSGLQPTNHHIKRALKQRKPRAPGCYACFTSLFSDHLPGTSGFIEEIKHISSPTDLFTHLQEALQRLPQTPDVKSEHKQLKWLVNLKIAIIEEAKKIQDLSIQENLNTALQQIDRVLIDRNLSTIVPKKIHFVWTGKLDPVQVDYAKIWQYFNPNYEIKIWHDKRAFLVKTLFQQLTDTAKATHPPSKVGELRYSNEVIRLQNEFFRFHKASADSLDQSIIDFLSQKEFTTQKELLDIQKENIQSFDVVIQQIGPNVLAEINPNLFKVNRQDDYPYYLKELALRQNLASASDKARYPILYQEGGIYVDLDRLPKVDFKFLKQFSETHLPTEKQLTPNILSILSEDSIQFFIKKFTLKDKILNKWESNIAFRYFSEIKLKFNSLILDCFAEAGIIQAEERAKLKQQPIYKDISGWESRDEIYSRVHLGHDVAKNFEESLDQWTGMNLEAISSTMKAALDVIRERGDIQKLMEPLNDISVIKLLGEVKARISPTSGDNSFIAANTAAQGLSELMQAIFLNDQLIERNGFDQLTNQYSDFPERIQPLQHYRYDSLLFGSAATAESSGPAVLKHWMVDRLRQFFEKSFRPRLDSVTLNKQLDATFGLATKLTTVTEESRRSSWLHEPFAIALCKVIPGDQKRKKRAMAACIPQEAAEVAMELSAYFKNQQSVLKALQKKVAKFPQAKLQVINAAYYLSSANDHLQELIAHGYALSLFLGKTDVFLDNLAYVESLSELKEKGQTLSLREDTIHRSFVEHLHSLSDSIDTIPHSKQTPLYKPYTSHTFRQYLDSLSGDFTVNLTVRNQLFETISRRGQVYTYLSPTVASIMALTRPQLEEILRATHHPLGLQQAVFFVEYFDATSLIQASTAEIQASLCQPIQTILQGLAAQDTTEPPLRLKDSQDHIYEIKRTELYEFGLQYHPNGLQQPGQSLDLDTLLTQAQLDDSLANKKFSLQSATYIRVLQQWIAMDTVDWERKRQIIRAMDVIPLEVNSSAQEAMIAVRQIQHLAHSTATIFALKAYIHYKLLPLLPRLENFAPLTTGVLEPMPSWKQSIASSTGNVLFFKSLYDIGLTAYRGHHSAATKQALAIILSLQQHRIERGLVSLVIRAFPKINPHQLKHLRFAARIGVVSGMNVLFIPELVSLIKEAIHAPPGSLEQQDAIVHTIFSAMIMGISIVPLTPERVILLSLLVAGQMSYTGYSTVARLDQKGYQLLAGEKIRAFLKSMVGLDLPKDVDQLIAHSDHIFNKGTHLFEMLHNTSSIANIVSGFGRVGNEPIPVLKVNFSLFTGRVPVPISRAAKRFVDQLKSNRAASPAHPIRAVCLPTPSPSAVYQETPLTFRMMPGCENAFVLLNNTRNNMSLWSDQPLPTYFLLEEIANGTVTGDPTFPNTFQIGASQSGMHITGGGSSVNTFILAHPHFTGYLQGGARQAQNTLYLELLDAEPLVFMTAWSLFVNTTEYFCSEAARLKAYLHQVLRLHTLQPALVSDPPLVMIINNPVSLQKAPGFRVAYQQQVVEPAKRPTEHWVTEWVNTSTQRPMYGSHAIAVPPGSPKKTVRLQKKRILRYPTAARNFSNLWIANMSHIIGRPHKTDYFFCQNLEDEPLIDPQGGGEVPDQVHNCTKLILSGNMQVSGYDNHYLAYIRPISGTTTVSLHNSTGLFDFSETDLLCQSGMRYDAMQDTFTISLAVPDSKTPFVLSFQHYWNANSSIALQYQDGHQLQPVFLPDQNATTAASQTINRFSLTVPIPKNTLEQAMQAYQQVAIKSGQLVYTRLIAPDQTTYVIGSIAADKILIDAQTVFAQGGAGADTYYVLEDLCQDNSTTAHTLKINNKAEDDLLDTLYLDEALGNTTPLMSIVDQGLRLVFGQLASLACVNLELVNYLHDPVARHLVIFDKTARFWVVFLDTAPFTLIPCIRPITTPLPTTILLEEIKSYPALALESTRTQLFFYREADDLHLLSQADPMGHCIASSAGISAPRLDVRLPGFYAAPTAWNISFYLMPQEDLWPARDWQALAQKAIHWRWMQTIQARHCFLVQPNDNLHRSNAPLDDNLQSRQYHQMWLPKLVEIFQVYDEAVPDIIAHLATAALGEFALERLSPEEIQSLPRIFDNIPMDTLQQYAADYFTRLYPASQHKLRWKTIWEGEDAPKALIGLVAKAYCSGVHIEKIRKFFMLEFIKDEVLLSITTALDTLDPRDTVAMPSFETLVNEIYPTIQRRIQEIVFFPEGETSLQLVEALPIASHYQQASHPIPVLSPVVQHAEPSNTTYHHLYGYGLFSLIGLGIGTIFSCLKHIQRNLVPLISGPALGQNIPLITYRP